MEKKFGIHMQDRSVAARSQGFKLYKAEDLPSNSNLIRMTAPAAKLVLLQRMTLDKDLDQRQPARDPATASMIGELSIRETGHAFA